jgi:hypothetical protein
MIKGEVSGSENVYVAGELEGSVELLEGTRMRVVRGRPRNANLQSKPEFSAAFP